LNAQELAPDVQLSVGEETAEDLADLRRSPGLELESDRRHSPVVEAEHDLQDSPVEVEFG